MKPFMRFFLVLAIWNVGFIFIAKAEDPPSNICDWSKSVEKFMRMILAKTGQQGR